MDNEFKNLSITQLNAFINILVEILGIGTATDVVTPLFEGNTNYIGLLNRLRVNLNDAVSQAKLLKYFSPIIVVRLLKWFGVDPKIKFKDVTIKG